MVLHGPFGDEERLADLAVRVAAGEEAQHFSYGVDVINVSSEEDLSPSELTATVEEAHRHHLKVAVHAFTSTSIQTAIDPGADSIEHGDGVTDAELEAMRAKRIFFDVTETFYRSLSPATYARRSRSRRAPRAPRGN